MKNIKKVKSKGVYIFKGQANANSCFIEKIIDAKKFLIYANYFLKDYLRIYDYVITKDGWVLVVKIKDIALLAKAELKLEAEEWRLISERMRLFLSTFVRVTNKRKGRTGCLVHSSYERYYFESKEEALVYLEKIRNQKIKFYSKKKYRGIKSHFKISMKVSKGSIFLCSKDIRKKKNRNVDFGEVIDFIDLGHLVVLELVNSTINQHSYRPNLNSA